MELGAFASAVRERVTSFMRSYIDSLSDDAPKLKEGVSYALLLGGKRARPVLAFAAGRLYGTPEGMLDYAAAAVECIHSYSLVHDDMPEMDNDTLRRGNPTVHVKFGQAGALLIGDTLQALAFQILSDPRSGMAPSSCAALTQILAHGAGYEGMCGGQSLDLDAEHQHLGLDPLRKLHSKKTGALIRAAVLMGAQCGGQRDPEDLKALDEYARHVGLAFQVWDDVMDVTEDSATLGKNAGSDLEKEKSTYPALLGVEGARRCARDAADAAKAALSPLRGDASLLMQFADFAVSRDH
ncbi:MAG: farnesyl diphosphate synthase [Succinivibrio sp.]